MKIKTALNLCNFGSMAVLTLVLNIISKISGDKFLLFSLVALVVLSILAFILRSITYNFVIGKGLRETNELLNQIKDGNMKRRFEISNKNEICY